MTLETPQGISIYSKKKEKKHGTNYTERRNHAEGHRNPHDHWRRNSIIVSILAIIGIAAIAYLSDGSASLGLLYASGALLTVSSVAELIAGILGTANCKKPEKAKTCLAWGIVVAVLAVAGIILNAIGGGGFSVLSLITGLVLPVLYIIGAVQNKQ